MCHRSAGLLLLLFSVCFAGEPGKLPGPVTVSLRYDREPLHGVLDAMEREVEAAVAPAGVSVTWEDGFHPGLYDRITLIRITGDCRADAPLPMASRFTSPDAALGQTHIVDGKVLPMAEVHCDAVRRLIDRHLQSAPAAARDELLGRALGRVAAHELYHMLLRTRHHGREGLARAAQSSTELVAPRESFAPADERRLTDSGRLDAGDSSSEAGR